MINRKEFLDKILTVAPALSDRDLIPALSHFWFSGDDLMAFNDQIAISVPFKSEFCGAVPGSLLVNLMKNSKARNIELTEGKSELLVKAASSRIKFALLPPDSFLFEMPEPEDRKSYIHVNMNALLDAVENCMRSVGMDTSIPDQLGITLIPSQKHIDLYSTNNNTMSHAKVSIKEGTGFKDRVILSAPFCQQLLKLGRSAKSAKIYVDEDHALLVTSQNVVLFGRTIESDRPIDFEEVINVHFPKQSKSKLCLIPTKMKLIIERATIISNISIDDRVTKVTVKDGKMKFDSKSDHGQISDYMQINGKHPDVSVRLDPKLLKLGYGYFERILITERCAVMANSNSMYMVASVGR